MTKNYSEKYLSQLGIIDKVIVLEIIENAIKELSNLNKLESKDLQYNLLKKLNLRNEEDKKDWLKKRNLDENDFVKLAEKDELWKKWCTKKFSSKIKSLFKKYKDELDLVVYSLIRVKSQSIANELFQKIYNNEFTFEEIAKKYSLGQEKYMGGRIGPVAINSPNKKISELLKISKIGQIWQPRKISDWWIIIRLEEKINAVLDETTKNKLLLEEGEKFLKHSLEKILEAKN